jgi:heme-degrading monooxygenase HmoA
MSVIMGLRISADRGRFEQALNSDPERLQGIAERAKSYGAIHHRFYASPAGDEVLVVDEWPDPESFQRFFEASPDIGAMMGEAGVTSEPHPEFWHELDTPDKF